MGASCSPRQGWDMNTRRGSAWQFLGAGVRRMKASGCWGVQFRVTNFTNGSFISTQEWFACRRLNLSSHGDIRGLRLFGNSGRLCLIRWQGIPLWSSEISISNDFLCFSKTFSEVLLMLTNSNKSHAREVWSQWSIVAWNTSLSIASLGSLWC